MTDLTIPYAGEASDRATLLLAAAEDLGYEPEVVRTITGAFRAPEDVVDKAGLGKHAVERQDDEVRSANAPAKKAAEPESAKKTAAKAPAKKAAAKKTTAKKAAKKAPAKKTAGE